MRARAKTKMGPQAHFQCLAEREGFEPSISLLSLYSLSRGAPSTTRPPLRYPFYEVLLLPGFVFSSTTAGHLISRHPPAASFQRANPERWRLPNDG